MITAWIVVTVVSKSSTSVLIETFIADWSSTITNCAIARATSGSQFVFGAGSVSVSSGSPLRLGLSLLPLLSPKPHPFPPMLASAQPFHPAGAAIAAGPVPTSVCPCSSAISSTARSPIVIVALVGFPRSQPSA